VRLSETGGCCLLQDGVAQGLLIGRKMLFVKATNQHPIIDNHAKYNDGFGPRLWIFNCKIR
jgi:hypothetical protein